MIMINLTSLLCMLGLLQLAESEMPGCNVTTERSVNVYLGWPFRISCHELLFDELQEILFCQYPDYESPSYEEEQVVTCVIIDSEENTTLMHQSADFATGFRNLYYDVRDFNKTTSTKYQILASFAGNNASYVLAKLTVSPRELRQQTCEESFRRSNPINFPTAVRRTAHFTCQVSSEVTPSLNPDFIKNLSVTWYKDCKKLPPSIPLQKGATEKGYSIQDVTYEHPGTYSCAVMQNGKKWFLNHYNVCVSPQMIKAESDIQCSQTIYQVELRKSVTVECWSHVKYTNELMTWVDWSSVKMRHETVSQVYSAKSIKILSRESGSPIRTSHECQLPTGIPNTNKVDGHNSGLRSWALLSHDQWPVHQAVHYVITIKAAAKNRSSTTVCHERVPTEVERNEKNLLLMKFVITYVTEADLGKHVISLNENSRVTNFTFFLSRDLKPSLHYLSATFGICVSSLLFLIALLSILWWRRIHLMVIWKRKFGSCAKDDKRYGAYFLYYFSNDLDKFSQQQAIEAVTSVRVAIENLGYKVYDKFKDGDWSGANGEASLDPMYQCHRIVLILTSQFLSDHWNVFILQQGVRKMVMEGSKLIFILLPGMKEMIKQRAECDDTARMVRRVIKLNGAIEWSDDPKFDTKFFSLFLEHKMPKLKSESVARFRTTVTSQTHYKNGFLHSLSSDTGGEKLDRESSIF